VLALSLLLVTPVAAQTAPAAPKLTAVRRAIDAGNAQYREAFLAMDAKRLADVYDPQGSRLGDQGQVVRGREAIAANIAAFVGRVGPVRVGLESAQVWLIDDMAYETGTWSYTYSRRTSRSSGSAAGT
jgi:uncharacterized protein (TIGR02246 family)